MTDAQTGVLATLAEHWSLTAVRCAKLRDASHRATAHTLDALFRRGLATVSAGRGGEMWSTTAKGRRRVGR